MDWITLLIEGVGVVILLMWIVIPIREFRAILKRIRGRGVSLTEPVGGLEEIDAGDRPEPRA